MATERETDRLNRGPDAAEIDLGEIWEAMPREPFEPVQNRFFDFPGLSLEITWTILQSGMAALRLSAEPKNRDPVRLRLPGKLSIFGSVLSGSFAAVLPDLGRQQFQMDDWLILRAGDLQLAAPSRFSLLLFAAEGPLLQKLIACAASDECQILRCFTCPQLQEPSLLRKPGSERLRWLSNQIAFPEKTGLDHRLTFETRCLEWLHELFRQPELSSRQFCTTGCSLEEENVLRDVAAYLEKNLHETPTLPELCRRFHLNEFKLKNGFKTLFGTTVFRHLRQLRVQKAEQLLRETSQTVLEIANAVGYTNPSHFARNFREQVGLLPKTYQSLHRRNRR